MALKNTKAEARILWKGQQLGLMIVNHEGESLFIYDKPLLAMWKNRNELIEVKTRDRDPEKAIKYHPGDIWGVIKEGDRTRDEGQFQGGLKIVLYLGEADRSMKIDSQTGLPCHYVDKQEYNFPQKALESLLAAIDYMDRTSANFKESLDYAETRPISRQPKYRGYIVQDESETEKTGIVIRPVKEKPVPVTREAEGVEDELIRLVMKETPNPSIPSNFGDMTPEEVREKYADAPKPKKTTLSGSKGQAGEDKITQTGFSPSVKKPKPPAKTKSVPPTDEEKSAKDKKTSVKSTGEKGSMATAFRMKK